MTGCGSFGFSCQWKIDHMLCLVWRHFKQQLCSFFKLPGATGKVISPQKAWVELVIWQVCIAALTKFTSAPNFKPFLYRNPTPVKKSSITNASAPSALYKEWPWEHHHRLVSVLQGTRARRLSKQSSSSSVRDRKPFRCMDVKYFEL